jgi:hypothetical protein
MRKYPSLGVRKKLKNWENWKNQKKITEKPNRKKKPIKILKKPTNSVRFRFYKLKTEKTEPNPNRKKPSQTGKTKQKPSQTGKKTEPNWFEPVFILKNRTKPKPVSLNRFRCFFFKKFNLIIVF